VTWRCHVADYRAEEVNNEMSGGKEVRQTDALFAALKNSLAGNGTQAFSHIVLYTSFGVVRGRTGLSFARELAEQQEAEATGLGSTQEVLELHEASVEHYSNHLPTATFSRLHVRLVDVRGFALVGSQG
jgi:hypothetical protein